MQRPIAALAMLITMLVAAATPAAAQVVETPEAFDSAGRVMFVTPALAERLALAPPAWPVTGAFEEVRLYRTSDSTAVLVVRRRGGALERYTMDAEQRRALREQFSRAATGSERGALGAQSDVISEPAGSRFVRNQATLGIVLYGPLAAATVASDAATAASIELLVAGGTFFAALNAARNSNPPITTAQNDLATHAAIQGAIGALGLAYVTSIVDDGMGEGRVRLTTAMTLAGALTGTVAGLRIGRSFTDAEARAATAGAYASALTSIGLLTATGAMDVGGNDGRVQVATILAAGGLGYSAVAYPRRARYSVTSGDVNTLGLTAALGLAYAGIPLIKSDASPELVAGALTAGFLTGIWLGDRLLVKPYDHTDAEAGLLSVGIGAGALMAAGVHRAVRGNSEADARTTLALLTAGATVGLAVTEKILHPTPDGRRAASATPSVRREASRVSFTPTTLAFAAARLPGNFPVLTVRF